MLAAFSAAGEEPTLLAPTPTAALRVRRALSEDPSAFGSRVETPASWVADRWELFGDGRRLVNAAERELLVRRALVEAAEGFRSPHSGMPYVLDRFEEATRLCADAFDDEEAAVARGIARIDGQLRRERDGLRAEQTSLGRDSHGRMG